MDNQGQQRTVIVLGASGLIGRFLTDDLRARGFHVIGMARRFSSSQRCTPLDLEMPIMAMDAAALARLIRDQAVDTIVNCLGVLQDGLASDTRAVHSDFVARLLQAIAESERAIRLIHISIPGETRTDRTAFATTKREGEQLIAASGLAYAILRPGFVIAANAYGGSSMVRALAALPFDLPARESGTPFQPVAADDIATTVAWLVEHDPDAAAGYAVTWDLMQPKAIALCEVIDQFRGSLGTAEMPRIMLPTMLLDFGAKLGDLASLLGWSPPIRTTALEELRRGVTGDPRPWMAATGIMPKALSQMIPRRASIQEKWFARLFLLKPIVIVSLALFWILSGSIALTISFPATTAILTSRGWPEAVATPFAAMTSAMDISVGVLIAFRRTAAFGLLAGIAVALGYMAGTALLTPDLWLEPLGALVKTGPAIVLMGVGLLTLDNR